MAIGRLNRRCGAFTCDLQGLFGPLGSSFRSSQVPEDQGTTLCLEREARFLYGHEVWVSQHVLAR